MVGPRIVDMGAEWRNFAADVGAGEDHSRVGAPINPLMDGASSRLETTIAGSSQSNLKRTISSVNYSASDQSLMNHFRTITSYCERIGLSRLVADRAKQFFKKASDENLLRGGRFADAYIAACIYVACKNEAVGRTFKDLSSLTKVPRRDIGRCYKELQAILGDEGKSSLKPEDLITRYCALLRISSSDVERLATQIIQRASALELTSGKTPMSVASVAIFMACQLVRPDGSMYRHYRDISEVAGITEGTVRSNYRELYVYKEKLLEGIIDLNVLRFLEDPLAGGVLPLSSSSFSSLK